MRRWIYGRRGVLDSRFWPRDRRLRRGPDDSEFSVKRALVPVHRHILTEITDETTSVKRPGQFDTGHVKSVFSNYRIVYTDRFRYVDYFEPSRGRR